MELAVSSLQPPAGSPQTGPAECAERLNPPPQGSPWERGVLNQKSSSPTQSQISISNLHFQSPFPISTSNLHFQSPLQISTSNLNFQSSTISNLNFHPQEFCKEICKRLSKRLASPPPTRGGTPLTPQRPCAFRKIDHFDGNLGPFFVQNR